MEVVINFTFPLTIEDYVHRIGRSGRGGKTGISHTLFTSFDKAHAGALQNILREASQVRLVWRVVWRVFVSIATLSRHSSCHPHPLLSPCRTTYSALAPR